jgi:glyoxylase-like metal-dependent hydrolase (beta-lactamase superfamily II)
MGAEEIRRLAVAGYPIQGDLITALPSAGYDMAAYATRDSTVTEIVAEGDAVDIGNRHFEVLHLPGH